MTVIDTLILLLTVCAMWGAFELAGSRIASARMYRQLTAVPTATAVIVAGFILEPVLAEQASDAVTVTSVVCGIAVLFASIGIWQRNEDKAFARERDFSRE